MEGHLAGVDVGEEVFADDERDGQRAEDEEAEEDEGEGGVVEAPGEDVFVVVAELFELAVELHVPAPDPVFALLAFGGALVLIEVDLGLEQEVHHGGDEGAGEEVGGHHGEGDGHGERGEEVLGGSGEEHDGDEDDADGEGGDEGGGGDLLGGIEDGADEGFLLGHVAVGVFDLDGGVVDEDADGEGEAAEGHDVDGLAEGGEDDHRGGDGERDGGADDEGGAPGAEEEQDHEAGERGGDGGFADDLGDGLADEDGLVEEGSDFEVGRKPAVMRGMDCLTPSTMSMVLVSPFLRTVSRAPRLPSCRTMLVCSAKPSSTWATSLMKTTEPLAERMGMSLRAETSLGEELVLTTYSRSPMRAVPAGRTRFCCVDGLLDVDGGDVVGVHQIGVGIDHDLPDFAAVGQRDRGAFDVGETRADEGDAEVVEFGFAEAFAGERKLDDGDGGGVELDDVGRVGAGGEDAEDGLNDGGDLRDGELYLDIGLKVDADDGDALVGLGLGVLDVVDGGGEGALADGDDASFHLGGGEAAVGPDDGDDGDIDVGEDILRGLDGRADAEEEDQEREDDEGIGAPEREFNNPHLVL